MSITRPGCKQTERGTAFEVYGDEAAPSLVLIHGLGLCRDIWQPFLPVLSARYRVISYDLLGHGDSAPAGPQVSLADFAAQIDELLTYFQLERASLIGFSIGGMINRRFAIDFPHLVQTLVILNSPHNRGDVAQKLVEIRARDVRRDGAMATLDSTLKRWFTDDFLESRPDVTALVTAWRQRVDADSYAATAWVLAHGVRELIRPVPPLTAPTLVMTCENDTGSTPQMCLDIAAEIYDAESHIIPRLQHLGLMQDPDAFAKPMMNFLERRL